NKQSIVLNKLVFFNCNNYRPNPLNRIGVTTILDYLEKSPAYGSHPVEPRIAVLKTTAVKALDNAINPYGNLNSTRIQNILSKYSIKVLDHSKLNVKDLIMTITKCSFFVTNWGATSAWHSFLTTQHCYCLVPFGYRREVNSTARLLKNICFHKGYSNNYTVSAPIKNEITSSDERLISADLKKLFYLCQAFPKRTNL
ncbi:hypothetical protein LCGC14_1741560, partial [marine sediment metagenome]